MVTTYRAGNASASLLSNDPRSMRARKREHSVQVRFAANDETVHTREGPVRACAGDAVVTGSAGEQWPVRPQVFAVRYRPLAPLDQGDPGTYMSVPIEVLALRMDAPFAVELADGERLLGLAGDWLVGYGDGSLAIVGSAIFPMTYDTIS
jgi:hypothetical protein